MFERIKNLLFPKTFEDYELFVFFMCGSAGAATLSKDNIPFELIAVTLWIVNGILSMKGSREEVSLSTCVLFAYTSFIILFILAFVTHGLWAFAVPPAGIIVFLIFYLFNH